MESFDSKLLGRYIESDAGAFGVQTFDSKKGVNFTLRLMAFTGINWVV